MDLFNGKIMIIENKKYIIIATVMHDNIKYAFTNEVITEDELTEEYTIFKLTATGAKVLVNEDLINVLLPKFQEEIKKIVKEI